MSWTSTEDTYFYREYRVTQIPVPEKQSHHVKYRLYRSQHSWENAKQIDYDELKTYFFKSCLSLH